MKGSTRRWSSRNPRRLKRNRAGLAITVASLCFFFAGAQEKAGPAGLDRTPGTGATSQECEIVESALRWFETVRGVSWPMFLGRSHLGWGLGNCIQLVSFAEISESARPLSQLFDEEEIELWPPGFYEWSEKLLRRDLESGGIDKCKEEIQETQRSLSQAFPGLWADAVGQLFDANRNPIYWSECEFHDIDIPTCSSWREWHDNLWQQQRPLDAEGMGVQVSRVVIRDRDALAGLSWIRMPGAGKDLALFLRKDARGRWVVRETRVMEIY